MTHHSSIYNFLKADDLRLPQVDAMERIQRWLILLQVCLAGLAYDQVEIPTMVYSIYAYVSTLGVIICQIHRQIDFKIYWLVPLAYLLVCIFWSISFEQEIRPEPLLLVLTCEYLMMSRESKAWIFVRFRRWIIVMCAFGLVCYLSYLLHLGLPYTLVKFYIENWNTYYANYHVAYVLTFSEGLGLMSFLPRLCGLYNEPGYLGTVCALVLMIDNLNLKRFGNVVIMLACVCTFSMAFWVIIFLYWIFKSVENPKRLIIKMTVIIGLIAALQTVELEDPKLQHLVERFQFKDGKVQGDNRVTKQFDKVYQSMYDNNEEIMGLGPETAGKLSGNLSAKTYILNFGLLGFAILWGFTLYMSLRYAKTGKKTTPLAYVFIAIFFVSTYQRPHIFNPLYMSLLFGGIDFIQRRALIAAMPKPKSRKHLKQNRIHIAEM